MNEKILNTIYKKLCDGFKIHFIPRRQFDVQILKISDDILEKITELTATYGQLKRSEIEAEFKRLITKSKDEFILEQFNTDYILNNNFRGSINIYTVDNLLELQIARQDDFKKFSDKYDKYIKDDNEQIVLSLLEFMVMELYEEKSVQEDIDNVENKSLENLFWEYFYEKYLESNYHQSFKSNKISEIINSPKEIIKKFSDNYLSNKFIQLLDRTEKLLKDETISNFDTVVVNIGIRDYEKERSGWTTSSYKVINNNIEYTFTNSSKDEKSTRGEFINIFIHQKKHLIKISVTLNEVERIPYIIYRDCEKVKLNNESEIVIVKHHGNETIVFDERKEALAFQTKLIEIREGMGRQK